MSASLRVEPQTTIKSKQQTFCFLQNVCFYEAAVTRMRAANKKRAKRLCASMVVA